MGMRKQLKRKTRRTTTFDLVLDDTTEAQALLDTANAELMLARLRADSDDAEGVTAATAARDKALAALLEHVCRLTFLGIPEDEFEEMRSAPEHAPTAAQLAEHGRHVARAKKQGTTPPGVPDFNPETLQPALFARCVVPDDGEEPLTPEEWAAELAKDGNWQESERALAFQACVDAILQPRSVQIPKG